MTVVLDAYVVPEQGEFEVYVRRTVNLRVTAEAARRTVQRWLLHGVRRQLVLVTKVNDDRFSAGIMNGYTPNNENQSADCADYADFYPH